MGDCLGAERPVLNALALTTADEIEQAKTIKELANIKGSPEKGGRPMNTLAPHAPPQIVVDVNLPDSPRILHIAEATAEPMEVVVGRLILLWQWIARHAGPDGVVSPAGRRMLVESIGADSEFWDAVAEAGFFEWTEEGLRVGGRNGSGLDQN